MEQAKMKEESFQITDFIPHRPPMQLVDEFVSGDEKSGLVRTTIKADWPLIEDGLADPMVLIEVVAQAAASLVGYQKRHEEREGGRGWLVGIRRTELTTRDLPVGTALEVTVTIDYEVDTYAVFDGTVRAEQELLAQVQIQTFKPDLATWEGSENEAGEGEQP
jgi:predicted hotdog family 3-hydroxylacyl-ACP dehydratase